MSAETPSVTPVRIFGMAWGHAAPLIIETAIRHGVFDALAGGPRGIGELAAATGASERGLRAIANALVGFELLRREGDRYALAPESDAFLVSSRPAYLGGFFRHLSDQLIPPWLKLAEFVRAGGPPQGVNQETAGAEFFAEFVEALFPLSYAPARVLAGALRLGDGSGTVKVLDVAAGSGVWGIALAQASPRVRVTAVDWPGVIPVTRRVVERCGVSDRFEFVAGDIQEADLGSGYDVAVLGHILHSEGEAKSRRLLQRVGEAMAPGGTIAIAEFLVNDDRTGPPGGLIFAVNMLIATDEGDTFSFEEIRTWLEEAGFEDARTLDAPGPSPLILATKRSV